MECMFKDVNNSIIISKDPVVMPYNELRIKKLNDKAIIPGYQSEDAAGFDLCSTDHAIIEPHKSAVVGTGLAFQIPKGCFGAVYARSGLGIKKGIRLCNSVGIIDADYRGEVKIALRNDGDEPFEVTEGMRCCQMVIQPYIQCDIKLVDDLTSTNRGDKGFGSTGV